MIEGAVGITHAPSAAACADRHHPVRGLLANRAHACAAHPCLARRRFPRTALGRRRWPLIRGHGFAGRCQWSRWICRPLFNLRVTNAHVGEAPLHTSTRPSWSIALLRYPPCRKMHHTWRRLPPSCAADDISCAILRLVTAAELVAGGLLTRRRGPAASSSIRCLCSVSASRTSSSPF